MAGTMRILSYTYQLVKSSKAYDIYAKQLDNQAIISERHRHRYEFNNAYLEEFKAAGMVPAGINPDSGLVEIVEIPSHPYFVGSQFHPEYKSTAMHPHPLFVAFVEAALKYKC